MLTPKLNLPTITQEVALNTREQWRWINGFRKRYKVSTKSRVKSVGRWVLCSRKGTKRWIKTKILKQAIGSHGYPVVNLRKHGKGRVYCVHRLVLETFVGPCPDGMASCHRDDVRTHNDLDNLYWGTPSENALDAIRNGRRTFKYYERNSTRGEKNHNNKLTEKDVIRIRKLCKQGILGIQASLAREYGVTQTLISNIVKGKCWKYLL